MPEHVELPLPKSWSKHVQLAILHVVALARSAITAARGCIAKSGSSIEQLRSNEGRCRSASRAKYEPEPRDLGFGFRPTTPAPP